jgi:hypothetical protein
MNLSDLSSLGIRASVASDGGLQLDAPTGTLTPVLIERIRSHKPRLITEILSAREDGDDGELVFPCRSAAERQQARPSEVHETFSTGTVPAIGAANWLLQMPERSLEVWFSEAVTHAEVLRTRPDALAAEPVVERVTRTATPSERDELMALVQAVYAGDADEDRREALDAALADPDGAHICYPAVAPARGLEVTWSGRVASCEVESGHG